MHIYRGSKLRSLCLHDRHFTEYALSPASWSSELKIKLGMIAQTSNSRSWKKVGESSQVHCQQELHSKTQSSSFPKSYILQKVDF